LVALKVLIGYNTVRIADYIYMYLIKDFSLSRSKTIPETRTRNIKRGI